MASASPERRTNAFLKPRASDHGVDLLGLHSVQLVDSVADLLLVGTEVDEEGEDVLGLRK